MTALSKTHAAVRHIAQHAPAALSRNRALLLDHLLTACASTTPPPGVLRQIVIAVRNLSGSGWLATHADNPRVSAFTRLDAMPVPPPLPVLDQVLSDCLWARFGPASFTPRPRQAPAEQVRRV